MTKKTKQDLPKPSKPKSRKPSTPRPYISWSQLDLFERSPKAYHERYFEGLEPYVNKYMLLGKRFAEALERGHDSEHDPNVDMLVAFMPSYPKKEHEMKANLDKIPLFGKLDGWNSRGRVIGEYKASKKWTQGMADKSGQLTFYALMTWLKYNKLPSKIFLHWAETTEDEMGELCLNGNYKTFETKRTLKDIILFSTRITKAWAGIIEMSEKHEMRKM